MLAIVSVELLHFLEFEHLLSVFMRLIIQICFVVRVLQVQVLLLGMFRLLFDSLQEVTGHGLSATHFLLSWLGCNLFVLVLLLFVLDALDSELVCHSVVNLPWWQLQVLMLLS